MWSLWHQQIGREKVEDKWRGIRGLELIPWPMSLFYYVRSNIISNINQILLILRAIQPLQNEHRATCMVFFLIFWPGLEVLNTHRPRPLKSYSVWNSPVQERHNQRLLMMLIKTRIVLIKIWKWKKWLLRRRKRRVRLMKQWWDYWLISFGLLSIDARLSARSSWD